MDNLIKLSLIVHKVNKTQTNTIDAGRVIRRELAGEGPGGRHAADALPRRERRGAQRAVEVAAPAGSTVSSLAS